VHKSAEMRKDLCAAGKFEGFGVSYRESGVLAGNVDSVYTWKDLDTLPKKAAEAQKTAQKAHKNSPLLDW